MSGGRRPDRLRRRRLARRLLRPGRRRSLPGRLASPRRPALPQPGRRHLRGRHRAGRASRRLPRGYGHGVAVGDYDNDGHPDLFVTRWRSYALLPQPGRRHLRGRHRAGRASAATATGRPRRPSPTSTATATSTSTSATTSTWDAGRHPGICPDPRPTPAITTAARAIPRAAATTSSATTAAGSSTSPRGRVRRPRRPGPGRGRRRPRRRRPDRPLRRQRHVGQLPVPQPGRLPVRGGRRSPPGVAANASGAYQAGMGIACGDLDGDGRPDLAVTNFYDESTTFFRNLGGGLFADHTAADRPGRAEPLPARLRHRLPRRRQRRPARPADGQRPRQRLPPAVPWRCRSSSWPATGGPADRRLASRPGAPFRPLQAGPRPGRGRPRQRRPGRCDRRLSERAPGLPPQPHRRSGHCLTVQLEGTASNRDAVGARVAVEAGGRATGGPAVRRRQLPVGRRPTAPLRTRHETGLTGVEVRWPSGRVDRHEAIEADRAILVREGEPAVRPLPGWSKRL